MSNGSGGGHKTGHTGAVLKTTHAMIGPQVREELSYPLGRGVANGTGGGRDFEIAEFGLGNWAREARIADFGMRSAEWRALKNLSSHPLAKRHPSFLSEAKNLPCMRRIFLLEKASHAMQVFRFAQR